MKMKNLIDIIKEGRDHLVRVMDSCPEGDKEQAKRVIEDSDICIEALEKRNGK